MNLNMAAINALNIFLKNLKGNSENNFKGMNDNSLSAIEELLNKCKTQMGTRCFRRWIKQPLQDTNMIEWRLEIVE